MNAAVPLRCALSLLFLAGRLFAHDSPEHTIEELTVRIDRNGPTPALLFQRASEWRVLGRLPEAADDLHAALELDPAFVPAQLECVQLLLKRGELESGLAFATRSLQSDALEPRQRAEFQFLKARLFAAKEQWEAALSECQQALTGVDEPPVDWPLLRSQLQARLGRHQERVAQVLQAWQRSGSYVLRTEWVEALIDAQLWTQALAVIEPELEKSRWRSSWLIRRARVRLGQNQTEAGHADLLSAIEEINQRLNPARPDLTLIADCSRAYRLLRPADRAAAGE